MGIWFKPMIIYSRNNNSLPNIWIAAIRNQNVTSCCEVETRLDFMLLIFGALVLCFNKILF